MAIWNGIQDICVQDAILILKMRYVEFKDQRARYSLTRNWISTMWICFLIRQKKIMAQSMMGLMSNQSF